MSIIGYMGGGNSKEVKELTSRVNILENRTGHVYGIKRKITDNTSSTWERIFDSVGLEANAKIATTEEVKNDFSTKYPWSEIKTCNIDSNGNITAYIDEPGFSFDGSNGEVFTRIPKFFWKRERITLEDGNIWEYIYIADYEKKGYIESKEFFIGRYNESYIDGKAHSISGVVPEYYVNLATFRNHAKSLGNGYCLMDYRIFIIQMLYLVEYADYNSQAMLGNGITAFHQAKAILEENSTNRIIVSSVPTGLYVGKTVCIGTTAAYNNGVAKNRQITAIEDYSDGDITGKAIIFSGDPVNIVIDNTIWGCAQITGDCDSLGMDSGCIVNDSYHSVIYRGMENIFSHIWQHIDGINIKDYQAYICYDPTKYANDKFTEQYTPLGYINANESDKYIKEIGYDENNPAIALPTVVGGSSSTSMCDNYWSSAGNKIVSLGGSFNNYWAKAGLFACTCDYTSSSATWNCGARLLKYQ